MIEWVENLPNPYKQAFRINRKAGGFPKLTFYLYNQVKSISCFDC